MIFKQFHGIGEAIQLTSLPGAAQGLLLDLG